MCVSRLNLWFHIRVHHHAGFLVKCNNSTAGCVDTFLMGEYESKNTLWAPSLFCDQWVTHLCMNKKRREFKVRVGECLSWMFHFLMLHQRWLGNWEGLILLLQRNQSLSDNAEVKMKTLFGLRVF